MVYGGQFGELRRRGSLIDDEEQLVRLVFTSARVVVIVAIALWVLLFCQPGTANVFYSGEQNFAMCAYIYDINHDYNYSILHNAAVTLIKSYIVMQDIK